MMLVGGTVFFTALKLLGKSNQTSNQQQATTTNEPAIYKVPLDKNSKEPVNAAIKKNDYIQFDSEDGGQHHIVRLGEGEHGGDTLDSGVFGADEGYRVQFKDIGTFYLQDKLNPDIKISVTVTE